MSEIQEKQYLSISPSPNSIKTVPSSLPNNPKKTLSKSLEYIFTFYAKQQKLVKLGSTFEDYQEDSTTLSVGEFLVFCKDFSIYSKEKLTKSQLIEVFKVNCCFRKEMNEEQFEKCLMFLANKMFVRNNANDSFLEFLKFLQVYDFDMVKRKCKGFSQPFFSDKGNLRASAMKVRITTDKNLPRVSKLNIQRFKSSDADKKIAKEMVIPCDAVITLMKRGGYSGGLKKVNSMACTWQTLSSLSPEQIGGNEKIFELINESDNSDDEILQRHYGPLRVNSKTYK